MAIEDKGTEPPPPVWRAVTDQAWFLLTLPALVWAGNAIVGRAVNAAIPPMALVFWRWALASLIALPLAWRHLRRDIWPMLRAWPLILLLAILGCSLPNALTYVALHSVSAINSVMMSTTMPVMIVLASYFILGVGVSRRQAAGIAISLMGALVMVSHGDIEALAGLRFSPGDLLLFGSVVASALYTPLLRLAPPVHPFSLLFGTFVLGALSLVPFYLAETLLLGQPMALSAPGLGAIVYTATFPAIVGYLAFNRAVVVLGANIAGLTIHLIPVFGVILSIAFLGELPLPYHFAGIALIATGVVLASRKKG